MMAQIVRLGAETAGFLDRIAPDVFDNPIDQRQLAAFLADPRHVMVLAIADGQVVGMASAVECLHPDKLPQLFINEVGVSPEYRRRGIGRRLVLALMDLGRERGCEAAWVGTEADNLPARACYRSLPGASAPQAFELYDWDLGEA
jgi:aminoglycoside 6'-N-acetyltransferase I